MRTRQIPPDYFPGIRNVPEEKCGTVQVNLEAMPEQAPVCDATASGPSNVFSASGLVIGKARKQGE